VSQHRSGEARPGKLSTVVPGAITAASPLVSTTEEEEKGNPVTATVAVPLRAGDVLQGNIKPGAPMLHDLVFSVHLRTEGGVVTATPTQMVLLEEQSAFYRHP